MIATTITDTATPAGGRLQPPVHLGFLDGIRGVAALIVVIFHFLGLYLQYLAPRIARWFFWTRFGHFAVDIFIVLSGFCLMLPVAARGSLRGGAADFILRRARRILPAYYAALILGIGLAFFLRSGQGPGAADIAAHLTLLHNLNEAWSGSINLALWSIATEWQIYFAFVLFLLPVWRVAGSGAAVAAGFAMGLAPHVLLAPHHNLDWACPWYLGLFAMGMAGAVYRSGRPGESMRSSPWALPVLCLAAAGYAAIKIFRHAPENVTDAAAPFKDLLGGLVAVSLILYCADLPGVRGRVNLRRILESPPLVILGSFSYSLYLTHIPVLQVLNAAFAPLQLTVEATFLMHAAVGIPATLVFAYGFSQWFERPFLRKRLRESGGESAP